MHINNLAKSKFVVIILLLLSFCFVAVFTACEPPKSERIYGIDDEWKNDSVSITLNSVNYTEIDDALELQLSFTIVPTSEWSINEQDIYFFAVADKPIYAIKDKSIELSGYNIFETKMLEESVCTFVFQIPLSVLYGEYGAESGNGLRVGAYLKPATFRFVIQL